MFLPVFLRKRVVWKVYCVDVNQFLLQTGVLALLWPVLLAGKRYLSSVPCPGHFLRVPDNTSALKSASFPPWQFFNPEGVTFSSRRCLVVWLPRYSGGSFPGAGFLIQFSGMESEHIFKLDDYTSFQMEDTTGAWRTDGKDGQGDWWLWCQVNLENYKLDRIL